MPKNKGKGGKNRRRGKNENDNVKRELVLKEDGQSYGHVTRILGNNYLEVNCFDNTGGKKRLCHIRGKLRKKVWINQGDVILVGLRDYQDDKADVIMKYLADEARELKRIREIPENVNISERSIDPNNEPQYVVFEELYENGESSSEDEGQLQNVVHPNNSIGSLSNDESSEDENDYFVNPNRMLKMNGNLNVHNQLTSNKGKW